MHIPARIKTAIALALIVAAGPADAVAEEASGAWPLGSRWPQGAQNGEPAVAVDGPALEQALHAEANAERTTHGLAPLAPDSRLVAVSRAHSRDMAQRAYFGHFDPEGKGPGERLQRGYAEWVGAYAENVYHVDRAEALSAAERTPSVLARRIVRGWMSSPGHRANLLRAEMSLGGLGVCSTPGGVWVTHLMGRPVAILAAPVPACVAIGRAWTLRLRLGPDLASPGAGALSAILVWPDPSRRFPLDDGTYLEGAEPLHFPRTGERVALPIPKLPAAGTYRLRLGRDGRYYDLGAFRVETRCTAP